MRKRMTARMAIVNLRMVNLIRILKVRMSLRWANMSMRIGIMGIMEIRTLASTPCTWFCLYGFVAANGLMEFVFFIADILIGLMPLA
jgi:hypothetical protein